MTNIMEPVVGKLSWFHIDLMCNFAMDITALKGAFCLFCAIV